MPQHRLSAARVFLVWSGLVIGLGLACSKTSTPARDGGVDRPNDVATDLRSDGADADRPAACTSDDGTRGKNIGEACGCGVQCQSGSCVDGYCCNTACTGTCVSCGLPSALGMCSPVPAGVRPRSGDVECKADSTSSCGLDGACDGKGACEKYPVGTVCKAGSCDGDTVSGIYRCDGSNQCTASFASICAPYGCNPATGSCFAVCTSDADCISGRKCIGGSCGPKMNGSLCMADAECASTHCVDGYCCNSSCTGACRACNTVGLEGTCTPLQAGKADPACAQLASTSCGTTGLCDEFSSCATFPATTICGSAVCTSATTLNTARTCDGISSCTAPESRDCGYFRCVNGICPSICTLDSDCKDGHPCVNKSCGSKLVDGQVCVANTDCQNGNCVDGVCCNTACTGACRSCSSPGSIGRCTLTPAGGADPRTMCASMSAATCGTDGKCDGSGNCRYWAAGTTVCATETCASEVYVGQSTCNASHQCIKPASQPCSPYRCNGTKCGTQCVTNVQCISPPNSCVNNLCGLSPDGASCSADTQCLHSHCVLGICCNSVCTGACQACNLAGSVGTCSNIASGVEPQGRCPVQPVSSCGTTGACTAGQCAKWPANSQCAAASCPTAGTQKPVAKCDGAGTCVTPATTSCAPGRCDTGALSCTNICTADTQCTPPATCVGGSCGLLPKGGACSSSTQCMAGLTCSARDSVCCDTACNGVCETCKPPGGAAGTCTAVQVGVNDPSAMCVAAVGTCGLDGTCKGNNTGLTGTQRCRDYPSSTGCRAQSCAAGMLTQAAQCTGSGACPAATVTSCGGYVCQDATQCKTTCISNADCMGGITCNTVTNKCGDKSALGAMCMVGTDCSSTFCTDGHCCDAACNGACQVCNSAGHCGPVADGTAEPMCAAAPPCGNTGNCRVGACEKAASTVLVSGPTCNGMNELVGAVFCSGMGAVGPTPAPQSCLGYTCVGNACKTTCTTATDCVAPLVCNSPNCIMGTGGMMGSGGAPGTGGAGTGGAGTGGMTGTGGDTGAGGAGGDTGGMGG